ncbi:hypothetical protein BJ508DRAFT_378794 [Ascobolus immersus RN42]|uniref:Uncharacterized protein n=1 Tax=Ascobolus immersus RN42 TaxID=1160509 RepID=A0A3N4HV31_ASCIM|nr:hypothetical protein BJ508DRAFT_378794 [Ascobolus immersus RN42]
MQRAWHRKGVELRPKIEEEGGEDNLVAVDRRVMKLTKPTWIEQSLQGLQSGLTEALLREKAGGQEDKPPVDKSVECEEDATSPSSAGDQEVEPLGREIFETEEDVGLSSTSSDEEVEMPARETFESEDEMRWPGTVSDEEVEALVGGELRSEKKSKGKSVGGKLRRLQERALIAHRGLAERRR